MRRYLLLVAIVAGVNVPAVPARTVYMPPLHAWTDARSAPGGCADASGGTNVILQNLSDIPQTVTVRIEGEEMMAMIRRDSSPSSGWKYVLSKTFLDRATFSRSSNSTTVTLAKRGDPAGGDGATIGFGICCQLHTAGLHCTDGYHCNGAQILPIEAMLTHYTVRLPVIEVEDTNGAVQGTIRVETSIPCAGGAEPSSTLTPINGGKPF